MARDRKMRSINCPNCGKPMKKHPKKREYECRNPRCPVIFVRIHHGMKRVAVEPRLNERMIISLTNGERAEGRNHGVLGCSAMKAPYLPTSCETVRKMLKMARVGPGDVVYDLGCGDGRILIMAVKEFGAKKAVGYEIGEEVYRTALREVERQGLRGKIRLVNGDLFEANLSETTVITLYLNRSTNQRLKPKLERETRDGTRIVSHVYQLMGWRPTKKERRHGDTIYLYTVPESIARSEAEKSIKRW